MALLERMDLLLKIHIYDMAKQIIRIGSRRNGRIGLRKTGRRIPKGVIHVQASFNNTIVTVTDVPLCYSFRRNELMRDAS